MTDSGKHIKAELISLTENNDFDKFELLHWKDLTIGRSADCDIVLSDSEASSRHALLVCDDNHWKITDTNSTNGTYVNTKKITEKILKSGDIIHIGSRELEYSDNTSDKHSGAIVVSIATISIVAFAGLFAINSNNDDKNSEETPSMQISASASPTENYQDKKIGKSSSPSVITIDDTSDNGIATPAGNAEKQTKSDTELIENSTFSSEPEARKITEKPPQSEILKNRKSQSKDIIEKDRINLSDLIKRRSVNPTQKLYKIPSKEEIAEIIARTPRITKDKLINKKSDTLQTYFFADNINILILDIPNLNQQGLMFNRLLAFTEVPGASRSNLLTNKQLTNLILSKGLTFDTFAFGNDFAMHNVAEFFTIAHQTDFPLNDEEKELLSILLSYDFLRYENGKFMPLNEEKAIVSITQIQEDDLSSEAVELVDKNIRKTTLIHEISHGEFFTNPDYRNYCFKFWREGLSDNERELFIKMFERNSYDSDNLELSVNEMQAFLMNTPDERFFNASSLGITKEQLNDMRRRFLKGNPPTQLYKNRNF